MAKFDPSGSDLVLSTYLGGLNWELGEGIAVEASGNILFAGHTWSYDFPIANAYQPENRGLNDAFVTKLRANGQQLIYSTYIDTTGGPYFTDVPTTDPFYTFVETTYNRQVLSGYSDRTFRPGNPATRGQIARIVHNAITQP